MSEKKSLTDNLRQAAERKLGDSAPGRAVESTRDLQRPAPVGGSGINPYGPAVERRRAAFEWLSNLNPRSN